MYLKVVAEGASEADLKRGAAAAEQVFTKAGIEPIDGLRGWMALEKWDIDSFAEECQPPENLGRYGDVWLDAQEAALKVALENLPAGEGRGQLQLILSEADKEQYFHIPD